MNRFADPDAVRLRYGRKASASCGRQWDACPRESESWRRRDEVWRLAFNLLGGAQPARRFLGATPCDADRTALETAMASTLGQLQVSLSIRRTAAAIDRLN